MTRSDTEAIVHGYEERGLASLGDLEGMFAIALWDASARTLVLARDRLGIKPLYYAVLPEQIVFASELKALVEHPAIDRTLDLTALSRYLAHEYVPAPSSIFRSIRKLPAGHWLTYTDGRLKVEPYWSVQFRPDRTIDVSPRDCAALVIAAKVRKRRGLATICRSAVRASQCFGAGRRNRSTSERPASMILP